MTKISFIYFDIGGVIVKDFSASNKWTEMLIDLGVKSEDFDKVNSFFTQRERKLCTALDADALIPELKKQFNINFAPSYSLLADFVNRFEQNKSIWPVIKKAQSKYHIGLLTNMYARMMDSLKKADLLPPIKWDVVIDSSVVGTQKPDSVIYQIATKWSGEVTEEILFVDNVQKNLNVAKKAGWHTFFYDSHDYKKSSRELEKTLAINN